jgi:pyrimidine-nucleoside phosphorylase
MTDSRTTTAELIAAKRDGQALSPDQIEQFLEGAVSGSIPDYQVTAMLMAIYFKGMTNTELASFTRSMIDSGDRLSIDTDRPLVDKHSTGGVGDKVSIPLAPLMAACGLAVPMMSGRGLGHTGGTLDKLEAIPGFNTSFSPASFARIVESVGCIIAGQSERIVPADRVLYRLRDTTATVASVPLISSSIMSKKLAEGLDSLVLDIKVGRGAFMRTDDDARTLARTMIETGAAHSVNVRALLTTMDQPLGYEVGNANEVAESIDVLTGSGPEDVTHLVFAFGAEMLDAAGISDGRSAMERAIASGAALERFAAMIEAQGGDPSVTEDTTVLPQPTESMVVSAEQSGLVTELDAKEVGLATVTIGAGRATASDLIDPSAGITLHAKLGTSVGTGDPLATVSARSGDGLEYAAARLQRAIVIGDNAVPDGQLIRERMK